MMQREKQSKALGAAFLAHQVSQLESKLDTLTFSRDHQRGNGQHRGRGRGRGGGAAARSNNNSTRGGAATRKEVRVLDASTLVHALPLLKKWIREDKFQFIVPLSGKHSLLLSLCQPPPNIDCVLLQLYQLSTYSSSPLSLSTIKHEKLLGSSKLSST